MELNREQVVKALECCIEGDYCATCRATNYCGGVDDLMEHALALIRELTEENERLATICDMKQCVIENAEANIAQAKADTVRKMLQRIKEDAVAGLLVSNPPTLLLSNPPRFMLQIPEYYLDQIAKELLEEGK